jgi:molecular chaperone GrpE
MQENENPSELVNENEIMEGKDSENIETSKELEVSEALEKELAEQKDKFLRLFAEFDNYKKRNAKERIELFATAGKEIIVEFLPILDDFERAIKSNENSEDLSSVKEGMLLIFDKMNKSFEKKGVRKINAKGETFNPDLHEAITEIPVNDESQKGIVIDEVECGYTLNDKIIRYSKVVVGK